MIGIFDSGVGGMTVARAIEQRLPHHPIVYLGDIARSPYGTKSKERIIEYSLENAQFLVAKGAKIIVIACNSASSVAADILQEKMDQPIIEVITPAVEEAIIAPHHRRIAVIGTRATVDSGIYEKKIRQRCTDSKVFSKACPLLVSLVEEGWINKRETKMILRRYLAGLKRNQPTSLVLGCTHYPMLKNLIQARIGKRVKLIDSSECSAAYVAQYLQQTGILKPVSGHTPAANRYYVTDKTETAEKVSQTIFKRPVQLLPAE